MKWKVVALPQAHTDLRRAADWYDNQLLGLGDEFIRAVLTVWDGLSLNPRLNCRKHPTRNIRWRYPRRFPYRVVYEVFEAKRLVVIFAVTHNKRRNQVLDEEFSAN